MPKQSPIIEIKRKAETVVPGVRIPQNVRVLRAFYEGVIACSQTKTCQQLTKNPYKEGSHHFNDWNTGWLVSEPAVQSLLDAKKNQFPFLKEAG